MRINLGAHTRYSVFMIATLPFLALALWRARWSDPSITHADRAVPMVALTFDDGLNGDATRDTADALERYGTTGTFFVVADTLPEQAALAQRLRAHGHLLANHSYYHLRPKKTDVRYTQITRAQEAFKATVGECPRYFRPPWGVQTPFVNRAVRHANMRTVLWDVEVSDWDETDHARLAANVLAKIQRGSIVMLHDGTEGHFGADHSVMIAALPAILEGLKARGLTATRLDTLLSTTGYVACQ
ncbi:MAG: polysaccharide deacetylase family protein [Dehalococcoidia bacterium]|nr:polysaccharide deacetylase family protein [Dehalococcoidia bacterium]